MHTLEYTALYFVNLSDLVSLWLKFFAPFCSKVTNSQSITASFFRQLQMDNNLK